MTTYNVKPTHADGTPIEVEPDTKDYSTDLVFFGRTKLVYGQEMNQNLLHLLENFACPENSSAPGTPDMDSAITNQNGSKILSKPVRGQIWFNSTQNVPFIWNGTNWVPLAMYGEIGANWGVIAHNTQLPIPVSSSGYVFSYDECAWVVGPFNFPQAIDWMDIHTDPDGPTPSKVTSQYSTHTSNGLINGYANYLIVGIRDNVNLGTTLSDPVFINGLETNLMNFWAFDEEDGDRINTERTLPFIELSGTVGSTTGLRGGDTLALRLNTLDDLGTHGLTNDIFTNTLFTGNPFSFSVWVKFISFADGSSTTPIYTFNSAVTQPTYSLEAVRNDAGSSYLRIMIGSSPTAELKYPVSEDLDYDEFIGSWHHIVWGADGTDIFIQVDNGPRLTATNTEGLYTDTEAVFELFQALGVVAYQYLAHWDDRILSEDDVSILFNSGQGLTRAEMT